MNMNNRLLKIFIEVYEKLNMTQASESLFISQPSVSQAIKELEEFYETKLFERYPKKLYPTPEGDVLYNYSQQILGLYDEARKEILSMDDKGSIAIGANISAGTVLISGYIDEFHKVYPNVKVRVCVAGSAILSQKLYHNEIDLALMEDLMFDNHLIQEPFYKDRIVFVCSPENPLAGRKDLGFADLEEESFLLRSKGVGARDKFDYLMKLHDVSIEPLWESTNTSALVNAAKADYGIAVLPYLMVKKELENGSLAELDLHDDTFLRNLNVTYSKNKVFNKWTKEFIRVVRSEKNTELSGEKGVSE